MQRPCNPQSAKAGNPIYRCNELTGRWVKVMTNVNRRRTAAVSPTEEPVAPIAPIEQRVNQGQRRQQQQRQQMIRQLYHGMQSLLSSLSSPEELTRALRKLSVRQLRILALQSGIEGAPDMTNDEIFQQLRTRYTSSPAVVSGAAAPVINPVVTPPTTRVVQQQQRRQVDESVTAPNNENDEDNFHVRPNFEIMALYQLQHYAKEYNIRGRSQMTKPQLIRALTLHFNRYILNARDNQRIPTPYELETTTRLRIYASAAGIPNRTGMSRYDLIRILHERYPFVRDLPNFDLIDARNVTTRERTNRRRTTSSLPSPPDRSPIVEQQQQQETQDIQIQQIPQQQQWWKTRCNNDDGTLQSQEWKNVSRKDVIRFQGYCFTLSEIYSLLHRAFTSVDTSYGIPPLRLQIPSEPFGRIPFRLSFFLELRKKATKDNLPTYPEVMFFLRNVRKFYAEDGPVHRFLSQRDPHKAQVSASIEKFLLNKNILQMVRSRQRSNTEISWKFKNVISSQLTTPSSKLNYIQGKHF